MRFLGERLAAASATLGFISKQMARRMTGSSRAPRVARIAQARAKRSGSGVSLRTSFLADLRFYGTLKSGHHPGGLHRLLAGLSSPGLWLLASHRLSHFGKTARRPASPVWWLARLWLRARILVTALLWRSDVAPDCEISRGVYLADGGYLICGAKSIGTGSIVHACCTFGGEVRNREEGQPTIESDVWIGPNCILAGAITIGSGATILPGTFLTSSVEPRSVVRGNPGRVVCANFDNQEWRRSVRVFDTMPHEQ